MKTTMKKWGLCFLVLGLMSACGSDNDASGVANNNVTNNETLNSGVSNATGSQNFGDFINKVNNGQFEGKTATSGLSYYYYTSGDSNSANCDKLWGVIEYCTYSGSNYGSKNFRVFDSDGALRHRSSSFQNIDDFGDSLTEIKNTLVNRMKSASEAYKCVDSYNGYEQCLTEQQAIQNGQGFANNFLSHKSTRYIFKHDGKTYLVDLKKPLGAQPVGIMSNTGTYNYVEVSY